MVARAAAWRAAVVPMAAVRVAARWVTEAVVVLAQGTVAGWVARWVDFEVVVPWAAPPEQMEAARVAATMVVSRAAMRAAAAKMVAKVEASTVEATDMMEVAMELAAAAATARAGWEQAVVEERALRADLSDACRRQCVLDRPWQRVSRSQTV
jgi:hypothetical protein